jgi:hypothetical protein
VTKDTEAECHIRGLDCYLMGRSDLPAPLPLYPAELPFALRSPVRPPEEARCFRAVSKPVLSVSKGLR